MPVSGIKFSIADILINAWNVIQNIIPLASSLPKLSGAVRAILTPLQNNSAKAVINIVVPTKPNSSPIIAKIESLVASGR